jgi:hypothetical protein
MKRFSFIPSLLAIAGVGLSLVLAAPKAAQAGSVYDRTVITSATAGVARWTNNVPLSAILLKNIWITGAVIPGNTVTVTRVISGTDTAGAAYMTTQAVGSVVCTSGSGNTTSFTASCLKPGDLLVHTGLATSNFNTMVEYEVQQH